MSDLPDTPAPETSQPDTPENDTAENDTPQPDTVPPQPQDDDGSVLQRSADSIREAREAGSGVAANEDITTLDEDRAGEHSDNPDGGGGLP